MSQNRSKQAFEKLFVPKLGILDWTYSKHKSTQCDLLKSTVDAITYISNSTVSSLHENKPRKAICYIRRKMFLKECLHIAFFTAFFIVLNAVFFFGLHGI